VNLSSLSDGNYVAARHDRDRGLENSAAALATAAVRRSVERHDDDVELEIPGLDVSGNSVSPAHRRRPPSIRRGTRVTVRLSVVRGMSCDRASSSTFVRTIVGGGVL